MMEAVRYPVEAFTMAERERLTPHFTNLDRPVFALVNLSETVKGALFARYSRYPGTLRRLFLDEFAADIPPAGQLWESKEGARAAALYDRVFSGFGDDSVAQLGGIHIACEWVSNVLTKILQRPRLAAYLEQSTRYIPYDYPMPGGGFRYYRNPGFGAPYEEAIDRLFETYSAALPRVREWVEHAFPARSSESPQAHVRAVNAKALDLVRGLLPAASLSHMGIYASGQTYEQIILHLKAHPLAEAREYGQMILEAAQAVIPSFVARVQRPDRGGRWIEYLSQREASARNWADRLGLGHPASEVIAKGSSVRLLRVDGNEQQLLCALLFEASDVSEDQIERAVTSLSDQQRTVLLQELIGKRQNRRYRPGRGFETLRYRFEIISDYGAFRDLQRHRMLTVQWQQLTPDLGAYVPEELNDIGIRDDYLRALDISRQAFERLCGMGLGLAATYALCLAYRIRYVLDLNAREAMHVIELRSQREGHPNYRAIVQEMYRVIRECHPGVAAAMGHVDLSTEHRLERILSELRTQGRVAPNGSPKVGDD